MSKGLRLYQITDTAIQAPVEGLFFFDKQQAKAKRRELNGENAVSMVSQHKLRYVVSPGPDHRNFRR